ncbi:MAG: uroporphyrinogen decarboxylase [Gemmatimonadetes bacterium]|nr:uroporphyrinogen decarboxylase [Gemmatimonadota bacterium]
MTTAALSTSAFLKACRREPDGRTPVWFMRQAGRYMPEYRAIRGKHTMLDLCATPELAARVTLQPVMTLGVDAAIIFSDILLPFVPMGLELEYVKGQGPVIHNPVRSARDVERLHPVDVHESLGYVADAVRMVTTELDGSTPLIGFAGAPFTLASYAIEGGGSRHFKEAKRFMFSEPDAWHALLGKFADIVADLLLAQIEAGAAVVQLFDSWAGQLHPDDYRTLVFPHSRRILERIASTGVPRIHFGVGTGELLEQMRDAGADVIGIDASTDLDTGWQRVGYDVAVQGNLDPVALFAPRDELRKRVHAVLHKASGRAGHIFNLGHGILPETPVDNVRYVVDLVHEWENDRS